MRSALPPREYLGELGVWDSLDARRVQPVARMAIFGDAPDSRLEFSAYDAGVATLAFIAESGRLAHALWERLERLENVRRIAPARCERLTVEAANATLALEGGDDDPRRARGRRGRRAIVGASSRRADRARRELRPARRGRELRDRQAARRHRLSVVPRRRGARVSAAAGEPNVDGVVHSRGPRPQPRRTVRRRAFAPGRRRGAGGPGRPRAHHAGTGLSASANDRSIDDRAARRPGGRCGPRRAPARRPGREPRVRRRGRARGGAHPARAVPRLRRPHGAAPLRACRAPRLYWPCAP